jgi:hypothetical protein
MSEKDNTHPSEPIRALVEEFITHAENLYRLWEATGGDNPPPDLWRKVEADACAGMARLEEVLDAAEPRFAEGGYDMQKYLDVVNADLRPFVRNLLSWHPAPSAAARTPEAVEAMFRNVRLAVDRLRYLKPAAEPRQEQRIAFDDHALTVTLDGVPYKIDNPYAYAIYKAVVCRQAATITRKNIRTAVKGVAGDKTIPRLIDTLPDALRRTVRSSTKGYWHELSAKPKNPQ